MENTESNGMGMPNAMWGNMNWGNTPPYWGYGNRGGAGGVAIAGLVTGVIGSVLGLATGGFGLAGMGRNNGFGPNGGQGGQNLYEQVQALSAELSAVKADVAVNTQRDIDIAKQTELMIECSKKDARIATLESEAKTTALITGVNNQVIVNAGTLACVKGKVEDLTQIGIPSANIITPPSGTTTTSTAGA